MKVLIACEESQRVCIAFREKGHEAYSCDLSKCSGGREEWHICGDARSVINGRCMFQTEDGQTHEIDDAWDILIAHPPCTFLTNGGAVRLFRNEKKEYKPYGTFQMVNVERLKKGILARDLFMSFLNADCKRIAVENPVPMSVFQLPMADQVIQPYMFGDPFSKKTCLWLKGLPPLKATDILEEYHPFINGGVEDLKEQITKGSGSQRGARRGAKHSWE